MSYEVKKSEAFYTPQVECPHCGEIYCALQTDAWDQIDCECGEIGA